MARTAVVDSIKKFVDKTVTQGATSGIITAVRPIERIVLVQVNAGTVPSTVVVPGHIDVQSLAAGMTVSVNVVQKPAVLLGVIGGMSRIAATTELQRRLNSFEQRLAFVEEKLADVIDQLERGVPSSQIREALLATLSAGAAGSTQEIHL